MVRSKDLPGASLEMLDELGMLGLAIAAGNVPEYQLDLLPIAVEVFLQERDDPVAKYSGEIIESLRPNEVGVTDTVITIEQELYALIDDSKECTKVDRAPPCRRE